MDNEEQENETAASLIEKRSSSPDSVMSPKKLFIIIAVTVAMGVIVIQILPTPSWDLFMSDKNMTGASSSSEEMYSVVFDAGSTGSRVFVFHFKYEGSTDDKESDVIKLNKETFMSIEPGISHYAHNPHKAADSLKPLLLKAVHNIPAQFHETTFLLFKATAGMRLLSKVRGEQIMKEIKSLFSTSSPFYLPNPEDVEVMGGSEEGLFGWLTVNFLLGTLWDGKQENSAVAIDLGGGSLQITFELPQNISAEKICFERLGEVYELNLINTHFTVHTHSFLGYGLKSAYLQVMGGNEKIEEPEPKVKGEQRLMSVCFEPSFKSTWHHGGLEYIIMGRASNLSRLEACQRDVDAFVSKAGFLPHPILEEQELHLFSYFIDIAKWTGLLPGDSHKAILTPADYYASAEKHCQSSAFSHDRPFQCMHLLYVYSILTKGLKLPSTKTLHVESRIGNHEVSWALGSALSALPKIYSHSRLCSYS